MEGRNAQQRYLVDHSLLPAHCALARAINEQVCMVSGYHCSVNVCDVLLIKSAALGTSITDRE